MYVQAAILGVQHTIADVQGHAADRGSQPMVRHILENLRNEGKLESLGTGRSAKWRKL